MAYEGAAVMVPGLIAGAGLTADNVQFRFVKLSADRTVVLVSAGADSPVGVLQAPVKATGDPVTVMAAGISKVRCASGSQAAGDSISADGNGEAATLVVTSTTYYAVGRFIELAGATPAEGVIASALIDCMAPTHAA